MRNNYDYQNLLLNGDLSEIDPLVDELITAEEERQSRKLIMIPSESASPLPVREALGSVFNNIYAEGYPRDVMREELEENLKDLAHQFTHYRRYGNRRFYKGTEMVDLVESLAGIRAKQAHATEEVPPEDIYVNVQPLSGSPANLAIYDSFVEPGGTVMGLALEEGGHLTHGSEFNWTGQNYDIASYSTDPETGRLDYDRIRDLALKNNPEMIIAGYTSYSWAPDWDKFSEIAEEVGATLLADISHVAGMSIAGAYPSPIGKADVVMHTTHKTLAGPRGAVVLTTEREKAEAVDEAIFPGMQGGPHPNKFAATAVAFKIAQTETYQKLQHQTVKNAKALADALQGRGLKLAYGGTDTHLVVIDLKELERQLDYTLIGEVASRILDEVRIVTNKNTVPGDVSAARTHGVRLGTPWPTQRGMKEPEMREIADVIADTLFGLKSSKAVGKSSLLSRDKIDLDLMLASRERIASLLEEFPPHPERDETYPEYYPREMGNLSEQLAVSGEAGAEVRGWPRSGLIEVKGHRPTAFLDQLTTRDIRGLDVGEGKSAVLLEANGDVLDRVEVIKESDTEETSYLVLTTPERTDRVLNWFWGMSDGTVTFDKDDCMKKIEGPVKVYDLVRGDSVPENQMAFGPVETENCPGFQKGNDEISPGESVNFSREGLKFTCYRSEADPEKSYFWAEPNELQELAEAIEPVPAKRNDRAGEQSLNLYRENEALFDLTRPYFVGQSKLEEELSDSRRLPEVEKVFNYEPEETEEPERSTSLLEKHQELGARIVSFEGWKMPLWFSSIKKEHRAVRETAGLFDVGHMGVFEVKGERATQFTNLVCSNYVRGMTDKTVQYNYLLDPEGRVMEDLMVYRLNSERYLLIVNAANREKDWKWLEAVRSGEYVLDHDRPWVELNQVPDINDLGLEEAEEGRLMVLALQGPNSRKILKELICSGDHHRLEDLTRRQLDFFDVDGTEAIVARTGYTGEKYGYELLIHPEEAPRLWDELLERGTKYGIEPAGLGARDSTRLEAGLPLYGHELGGENEILPREAGLGNYVKFHKPYFIGRKGYKEKAKTSYRVDHRVINFQMEEGARLIREESPVFDGRGKYLGYVTSSAKVGETQIGMAYVKKNDKTEVGNTINVVPTLAGEETGELELGSRKRMPMPFKAEILPRFKLR